LQYCSRVSAIEIDRNLYDRLKTKHSNTPNLKLYHQDFLKWTLPTSGTYKVFANIPFSHTTDILRKLTECKNPPVEAWLIMEKGAAKRFMGTPRETLRSLTLKPKFDLRIAYHFSREDFHPAPRVDVVMLHLKRKQVYDIPAAQWRDYERFISTALPGNHAGLSRLFTKRQLSLACKAANLHDIVSGQVRYIQWLGLFRCYYNHARKP